MAGPFGDLLPIPLPILPNVASIGDVFISLGLGWFVLATMIRGAAAEQETVYLAPTVVEPTRLRRPIKAALSAPPSRLRPGIPATPSYADALSLDRPTLLGGSSAGAMPVTALRRDDDLDLSEHPAGGPGGRDGRAADRRPDRRAPLRPPGARCPFRGLLAGPDDQPARRPPPPGGAWPCSSSAVTDSALATAPRLPDRGPPEPAHRAHRRHLRRSLGPPRDDGRQRPAASRARAAHPGRRAARDRPRLSARLPDHDHQRLLPAGQGGGRAAHRAAGRPAGGQLADVDRRDRWPTSPATPSPASSSLSWGPRSGSPSGSTRRPMS